MMRRIYVLMVMVLSLSILLCSCSSNHEDAGGADANSIASEDVPSQSISSNNFIELTDEEISWFNTEFFNNLEIPEQYIHNMFLGTTYETAAEIDLFELFYGGVDGRSMTLSEEELELLAERCGDDAYLLDAVAVSSEEMDKILRKYLGLGFEETEQRGLDHFIYLKEYDRYYNVAGDTHYQSCSVMFGQQDADGMIILRYEIGGKQQEVTLQVVDGSYRFVSNTALN